jgi:hypothetical protein
MQCLRVIPMAVLLAAAFWPSAAIAQSGAISGLVRDNTGAVLPGTTVEASSPALIEGRRMALTDGQGRYSIVGLRPGEYKVTFSLVGFNEVVREGIQLPANFTATLDVTLSVGSIEESVTVRGASPIVDVQQTQRVQVLDREVLDAIPTGRNTWSQAMLVAGVSMTGSDVGGSQHIEDLLLEAHGANYQHYEDSVDGFKMTTVGWNATGHLYYQEQAHQEVTVETGGGNAESSTGGVRVQIIPKEGGNIFSGTAFLGGTAGAWQGDNFSQALRNAGLQTVDKINQIFDYAGTVGGPIARDRLWFFTSGRFWGVDKGEADTLLDDGSPYNQEAQIWSVLTRVTWQATTRDKFSVHFDRQAKFEGPEFTATYPPIINGLGDDPETARRWQDPGIPYVVAQAKWTSVPSNRLLLEAGYGAQRVPYVRRAPVGVVAQMGTPEWYSRVQKRDLDSGVTWNAIDPFDYMSRRHTIRGSMGYVTGSHKVKVGADFSWGSFTSLLGFGVNGHLQRQQYRSGVPDSAIVTNFPITNDVRVGHEIGVFMQDSWTFNRLTINPGLRFDWLNAYVAEQHAPAGRFVAERSFPKIPDVPDWGPDVQPRLGLSYDLVGNAKTAIKFTAGRYVTPLTTAFAERFNPMALATSTLPWSDADLLGRRLPTDGDDIVQDNEIDLSRLPTNFGERQLDRFDPDIHRETNVETSVALQHELLPNVSVGFAWYRRSFHNFTLNDNLERDFSDYRPVEVVSPYNGEVFTVYDLKTASELRRVDTLVTNATEARAQVYHGFEFTAGARLPRGGRLLVGSTTQRTRTRQCDNPDDPNTQRFCDRFDLPSQYSGVPFRTQFKLAGTYPLPGGVQASVNFTSMPGGTTNHDIRLPINWLITPGTRYTAGDCAGKPCTAGAPVIPDMVLASLTVPLAPSGTERFLPKINQLDLGVRKTFRLAGVSYQAALELFNALNADTVTLYRSDNIGTSSFDVPSSILLGRMPRVSMLIQW